MRARMKNPAMVLPGAMEALQALGEAVTRGACRGDAGACPPASESDQWL